MRLSCTNSIMDAWSKSTKADLEEIKYHQWNEVDDTNYVEFEGYVSMSSKETVLEEVKPDLPEK